MSTPIHLPQFPPTPIDGAGLERYQPSTEIAPAKDKGTDFGAALTGALQKAGDAERAADDAAQRFAAGDPGMGIHEVMIAAEKASITVRYAVTLKNRVLEAYRDLMNTPL